MNTLQPMPESFFPGIDRFPGTGAPDGGGGVGSSGVSSVQHTPHTPDNTPGSAEKNRNTANKTRRDLHIVQNFIASKGDYRDIETIPPTELNTYLAELVLVIRRKDGKDFEPSSIRGILASVERHLRQLCTGISIFKDALFAQTRDAMRERFKQLTREGKGNKLNAAFSLSDDEIDILYTKNILGASSADSLINTLWLNNCLHFGLRGCIKNRNLKWGDVTLHVDPLGYEYLEYNQLQSKPRNVGENIDNLSVTKPRIYGNPGSDRDPIMFYKIYASKRPITFPDSPFYLAINVRNNKKGNFSWFKSSPMGVNKINSLMKIMAQKGGLSTHSPTNSALQRHRRKRLIHKPILYNPNLTPKQEVGHPMVHPELPPHIVGNDYHSTLHGNKNINVNIYNSHSINGANSSNHNDHSNNNSNSNSNSNNSHEIKYSDIKYSELSSMTSTLLEDSNGIMYPSNSLVPQPPYPSTTPATPHPQPPHPQGAHPHPNPAFVTDEEINDYINSLYINIYLR